MSFAIEKLPARTAGQHTRPLEETSDQRLNIAALFTTVGSTLEIRFRVIASDSRDSLAALKTALRPGSIVVLGGRKRWWPTKTQILARQLRRSGYEVIFKETE